MSNTIDQKIVELKFDNSQFESNVKVSMTTLEKLKQSLNFSSSSKSLENLGATAKNTNLNNLSSSIDTVKAKFSSLDVIGVTALANLTNSAVNAGKSFVKSLGSSLITGGITRAKNLEQANFMLEGLISDSKEVDLIMQNVNDAVAGTAYGLDQAALVAAQFAASGMRGGKEMEGALRGVAGAAAMTGSEYSDIGRIFTTVAGNGRLMGDQLLQFSARGLNVAAALADQLGVTEQKVREMVTAGEIDFETFAMAMDSAFGEHATAANKTFTGALSNMKAALSRIGAEVATPGLQSFRLVLLSLRDAFDAIHKVIMPFLEHINTVIRILSKGAAGAVQKFADSLMKVVDGEKVLTKRGDRLYRTFAGFFAILDMIRMVLGTIIRLILLPFQPLMKLFGETNDGLLAVTANIGDVLVSARDWMKEHNHIVEAVEKFNDKIAKHLIKLKDWILQNKYVKAVIDKVKNGILNFVDAFKKYAISFKFIDQLKKKFKEIEGGSKILENVKDVFKTLKAAIVDFFKSISEMDKVTLSGITGALGVFGNTMKTVFSKEWGQSVKTLINMLGQLKQKIKELITDSFNGMFDDKAIKKSVNNISKSTKSLNNDLDETNTVAAKVKKGLSKFANFIKDNFAGKLGIGELATIGFGIGIMYTAKQLTNLKSIVSPFTRVVKNLGTTIHKFNNVLDSASFFIKANAILVIAKAIAILVGSLIALAMVDSSKIWIAVGAIGALGAILVGLSFASTKMLVGIAGISKALLGLMAIIGSVTMLVSALAILQTIDGDKVLGNLIIVAGILGALIGIVIALNKLKISQIAKGSSMFIALAGSVLMLVLALAMLRFVNVEGILPKIGAIAALIAVFGGVIALLSVLPNTVSAIRTMTGLVLFSVSLFIMVRALKKLSDMPYTDIMSGLKYIKLILNMFTVIMTASFLAGKNAAKAGIMFVGIAISLMAMVKVIKMLAEMSPADFDKGYDSILKIMLIFSVMMMASRYSGDGMKKASVKIIAMSIAIGVLSAACFILSKINPTGLDRAIKAISTLMIVFGMMMALSHFMKSSKNALSILIVFTVIIGILAASIGALSMIDGDKLAASVTSMVLVMAAFSAMTKLADTTGGDLKTIIGLVGAIAILAASLAVVGHLKPEKSLAAATAMSEVMLALAVTFKIINGMGDIKLSLKNIAIMAGALTALTLILAMIAKIEIKSSMEKLLGLAAVMGALAAVFAVFTIFGVGGIETLAAVATSILSVMVIISTFMVFFAALGNLSESIQVREKSLKYLIDKGIDLVCQVTKGIGKMFGSFIGGIGEGVASSLPLIGTALSDFMSNASVFFDGISKIDKNSAKGAKYLAEAVLMLSGANFISAITGLTGISGVNTFSTTFTAIGEGLIAYSKSLEGLDEDAVTKIQQSAKVAEAMADVISCIPTSGGIKGAIMGEKDIALFGGQLISFGGAIVKFYNNLTKNIGDSINWEEATKTVEQVAGAAKVMVDLAQELPDTESFGGWFSGKQDLSEFGTTLEDFAAGLGKYYSKISEAGLNEDAIAKIKASAKAGKALAEMGSIVGDMAPINDDSLESFVNAAPDLATAINDFQSEIGNDVDVDNLKAASKGIKSLVSALEQVKDLGNVDAESFVDAAKKLPEAFTSTFSEKKMNITKKFTSALKSALKGVLGMKSDFYDAGETLANKMKKGVRSKHDEMVSAGEYLGQGFIDGMDNKKNPIYKKAVSLGQRAVQGVKDGAGENSPSKLTFEAGKYLDIGLINGIEAYAHMTVAASEKLGEDAVTALSDSMTRLSDIIDADMDTTASPVITPVLDVSEIQNGISNIDSMFNRAQIVDLNANINGGVITNADIANANLLNGIMGYLEANNESNGSNADVIKAINKLNKSIANSSSNTYNINGITYDDGSNITTAVETLVRATKIEGRV